MRTWPTTVRMDPELHLRAKRQAEQWSQARRPSLGAYLDWCIRQMLGLEFLTAENREWIQQFARANLRSELSVIDSLLTSIRYESGAAKLEPERRLAQEPEPAKVLSVELL